MDRAYSEPEVHKGFKNDIGQNNCFLNAALQTLWHLPAFRDELEHAEVAAAQDVGTQFPTLLPSVISLFANYLYGEDNILPSDEVRQVLSSLYEDKGRFRLGDLDDATECLEAILTTIHCERVGVPLIEGGDEVACTPPCPACAVFKFSYVDQRTCKRCGATSDPTPGGDIVYRVWVDECIGPAAWLRQGGSAPASVAETLEQALRRSWMSETNTMCPEDASTSPRLGPGDASPTKRYLKGRAGSLSTSRRRQDRSPPMSPQPPKDSLKCGGKARPERYILSLPPVIAFSLVWSSNRASDQDIRSMLSKLRCSLDLSAIFTIADGSPKTWRQDAREAGSTYGFSGMICYYGKHYVSLFARRERSRRGQWLLFDDATIREYKSWQEVREFCIRSRYQPTIVWFEQTPSGEEPWWTDDAPGDDDEDGLFSHLSHLKKGFMDGLGELMDFTSSSARVATPVRRRPGATGEVPGMRKTNKGARSRTSGARESSRRAGDRGAFNSLPHRSQSHGEEKWSPIVPSAPPRPEDESPQYLMPTSSAFDQSAHISRSASLSPSKLETNSHAAWESDSAAAGPRTVANPFDWPVDGRQAGHSRDADRGGRHARHNARGEPAWEASKDASGEPAASASSSPTYSDAMSQARARQSASDAPGSFTLKLKIRQKDLQDSMPLRLRRRDRALEVIGFPHSPGSVSYLQRAGLAIGDRILIVNGKSTELLTQSDPVGAIHEAACRFSGNLELVIQPAGVPGGR